MNAKTNENVTHVCFCFDENLIRQVLIAAVSVSESSTNPVHFHFIHTEPAESGLKVALKEVENYFATTDKTLPEFSLYKVPNSKIDECPKIGHLPKASALRLFIQDYLPKDIQKVIYLDGDIFATGNISELYKTDLQGFPVGAVQDPCMQQFLVAHLGLDVRTYFNAGVLLVDMELWRKLNVGKNAFERLRHNASQFPTFDQDALNLECRNKWLQLLTCWNLLESQHTYMSVLRNPETVTIKLKHRGILHFTHIKPWSNRCNSRYRILYTNLATRVFPDFKTNKIDSSSYNFLTFVPGPIYSFIRIVGRIARIVIHFPFYLSRRQQKAL